MNQHSRICAKIDLGAIRENFLAMEKLLPQGTKMFAVIKTDGYGHGSLEIAEELKDLPVTCGFCIATVEEGMALRKAGIKNRILILGYTFPDTYDEIARWDLTPAVFTEEAAAGLDASAKKAGKKINIHLAVDTGMSRIGLPASDAGVEEGVKIASFENLAVEGIFTHFAKADEKDKTFSKMQYDRFTKMIHAFEERGLTFSLRHCANSASIIDLPEFHLDAVRAGITLYGLWPSDEVQKEKLPIKPAMRLVSHIAHVKTVPAQTPVSYGGTFVTEKETVIATIPTGYGDGYPRSLSNKGWCLIGGKKAPILGRVCMDQFMADVTKIPEAKIGTEVVLIGDTLTMETVGDLSGRFNYELACDIGSRVPRVFVKDQKIVAERFF